MTETLKQQGKYPQNKKIRQVPGITLEQKTETPASGIRMSVLSVRSVTTMLPAHMDHDAGTLKLYSVRMPIVCVCDCVCCVCDCVCCVCCVALLLCCVAVVLCCVCCVILVHACARVRVQHACVRVCVSLGHAEMATQSGKANQLVLTYRQIGRHMGANASMQRTNLRSTALPDLPPHRADRAPAAPSQSFHRALAEPTWKPW